MPRVILTIGVIIIAIFAVLLRRRRREHRPVRRPPTSDDPVGAALADARPVSRFGDELDVNDLRRIVRVDELEPIDEVGHNTVVLLDEDVVSYADVVADGLEEALAEQPGIDVVDMDGYTIFVRSVLSLPDLHAATIRALLAINRSPRLSPRRLPRDRRLASAVMSALADGVATTLAGHGFVGRLRTGPDDAPSHLEPPPGPGFYRSFPEEGLIQVIRLRDGFGYHQDDGTIVNARLQLTLEVIEVATSDVAECIEVEHGSDIVVGERIIVTSFDVPATVDGIEHTFLSKALPVCEATTSREAIVDRWVAGLPWYVPDRLAWEAADVAARWGFRSHARDLVRYGARRRPQAAAVAAKHRL